LGAGEGVNGEIALIAQIGKAQRFYRFGVLSRFALRREATVRERMAHVG
jgi:hypothetical protein